MASSDGKNAAWTAATFVQTRTSGSAIPTSVRISPAWFIPNSTTATSGSSPSSMSDSGNPMWLFRLPRLRNTSYRVASNAAVSSFVVVFPTLPVIAMTRAPERRRT